MTDQFQTFFGSNSDSDVVKNFKGDINVALAGLPVDGQIDAHLAEETQFKTFMESTQKRCSCDGGNSFLADSLCAKGGQSDLYDVYQEWTKSAEQFADATNFDVVPIWQLMRGAKDDKLASYANTIEDAFYSLSEHPQTHYTTVTMIVTADWAEVGLLSPAAYIDRDPAAADVPGTVLSSTKLNWQSLDGQPANHLVIGCVSTSDAIRSRVDSLTRCLIAS